MKESCWQFGDDHELAGIVTEPMDPGPARRIGVVLVSAGLLPKSGPFRLYAELARRLSRDGFVTLRFDLGGIGDSRQGHGNLPLRRRTEHEVGAALDHLTERHGIDAVVLGGLCSGAEDAFRSACLDPRVRGVVLIDPFGYRTPGWYWRHLRYRVARRVRRAAGLYRPLPMARAARIEGAEAGKALVAYEYMESIESRRILKVLLDRRVHVHFLYTGGALEVFNHAGQLQVMFKGIDFDGLVTVDHFPHLEHTPMLDEDRRELVEAVARRLLAAATPGRGRERHVVASLPE